MVSVLDTVLWWDKTAQGKKKKEGEKGGKGGGRGGRGSPRV